MATISKSLFLTPFRSPRNIIAILIAAILIVVMIKAIPQAHAVVEHGVVAIKIRQCLDKNGPAWHDLNGKKIQYWQAGDDPQSFWQTCQLDDGKWGLQLVKKDKAKWWERTAFIKGDGSLKSMLDYLARNGTPFTGALP